MIKFDQLFYQYFVLCKNLSLHRIVYVLIMNGQNATAAKPMTIPQWNVQCNIIIYNK